MRFLAAFLTLALSGHAAVLQGVVLDFESGRALARTLVTLLPLTGGTGLIPQTVRTESNGSFFFGAAPGAYLLTLMRDGFATYRYGAKCWNCSGAALFLNGTERTAVDIRMHRLGAITGTLQDENQVGIPDIPVMVYTATRPLRAAGKTKTDDRGFFRFGELTPGAYVVRTVATQTRDGMSYLASFYPEGTEMKLARSVDVELEHTWGNVDFPPVAGKLYRVQGRVIMPSPGIAGSIDLISDSGREKAPVQQDGSFVFERVAPGNYELFSDGRNRSQYYAAWQPLTVEHDTDFNVQMMLCYGVTLEVNDDQRRLMRSNQLKVTMRRRDLDKEGPEVAVKWLRPAELAPGDWEVSVDTGSDSYPRAVTLSGRRAESRSNQSAEGWNLVRIGGGMNSLQVSISSPAASLSGRVLDKPNEPVPYAPVFLETLGLEPPDPPMVREARAGPDGVFQFKGLPPAKYRVISSFDLDPSDRAAMEAARPAEFSLAEGVRAVQDLSLYHKP